MHLIKFQNFEKNTLIEDSTLFIEQLQEWYPGVPEIVIDTIVIVISECIEGEYSYGHIHRKCEKSLENYKLFLDEMTSYSNLFVTPPDYLEKISVSYPSFLRLMRCRCREDLVGFYRRDCDFDAVCPPGTEDTLVTLGRHVFDLLLNAQERILRGEYCEEDLWERARFPEYAVERLPIDIALTSFENLYESRMHTSAFPVLK